MYNLMNASKKEKNEEIKSKKEIAQMLGRLYI